jgi:hypothetical protein
MDNYEQIDCCESGAILRYGKTVKYEINANKKIIVYYDRLNNQIVENPDDVNLCDLIKIIVEDGKLTFEVLDPLTPDPHFRLTEYEEQRISDALLEGNYDLALCYLRIGNKYGPFFNPKTNVVLFFGE